LISLEAFALERYHFVTDIIAVLLTNSTPGLSLKVVVVAIAELNNARNGFTAP
jgi:hypothetical protein